MRNKRSTYSVRRRHFSGAARPSIVVTVPVRDEAGHIRQCLDALASQTDNEGCSVDADSIGVVVLLNNCQDRSFEVACAAAGQLTIPVRIYDVVLPSDASHAGGARRAAMDLGADWLEEGNRREGLLLTTDADSRAPRDWAAANQAAIARGVDGVAGRIELDPDDAALLPAPLHERGRLEARYEGLLTELFSHLDRRPHDPWPRHAAEPGASLAVTLRAYRAVGGVPSIALGEDRALVSALEASGFRIRHDPAVSVVTSGRTVGRAQGGVADTIRLRCARPDAPCDAYLEPAQHAFFRGLWRGKLRTLHANALLTTSGTWAGALGLGPGDARRVLAATSFVQLWGEVEKVSPRLSRCLLTPSQLPLQILSAQRLLYLLRQKTSSRIDVHPAHNQPITRVVVGLSSTESSHV